MTRLLATGGADAVGAVLVGDELLLGSVADTNGAWLARELTVRGVRLTEMVVVPDDPERIATAVAGLSTRVGSVVVSGGIGPTSDDRTREALARVSHSELVLDDRAVQAITEWTTRRGRTPDAEQLRMARRPSTADIMLNPLGSAPGVRLELGGCVVYAVPGVPAELVTMVTDIVVPDLLSRSGPRTPLRSVSVEVALLGEPSVARRLAAVERAISGDAAVEIAYLARPAHVSVRVTVRDADEDRADAALQRWARQVRDALGEHVIGVDGTTLPQAVVGALVARHQTVAAAESLTGGGVLAALTSVPGASAVVRGGVTAYATDVKSAVLGVPSDLLKQRGSVDPTVAVQMAERVRDLMGSDWGVSTTGVAGPAAVGEHPPGVVFAAVVGPRTTRTRHLDLPGDRERVRRMSAAHVLDELRLCVEGRNAQAP
jgi:nicotinamide-nucleotide amidase